MGKVGPQPEVVDTDLRLSERTNRGGQNVRRVSNRSYVVTVAVSFIVDVKVRQKE